MFLRMVTLLLLAIMGLGDRVRGASYDLEGFVEQQDRLGDRPVSITNFFSLSVSNCDWSIHIRRDGGEVDYQEIACVNGVIYSVLSREGLHRRRVAAGQPVGANEADASIMQGPIPLRSGNPVGTLLWMAYCSGCYLDDLKEPRLLPVFRSDVALRLLSPLPVALSRLESAPRLPRSVRFEDDGVDHRFNLKRKAPFDQGFCLAEYRVLRTTNLAGAQVPAEFVLDEYQPRKGGANKEDLECIRSYRGWLAGPGTRRNLASYVPRLPGSVLFCDARAAVPGGNGGGDLAYLTNHWLTIEELAPIVRAERGMSPGPVTEVSAHRRRSILVALAGISFVFLGVFLWRASKTRSNDRH